MQTLRRLAHNVAVTLLRANNVEYVERGSDLQCATSSAVIVSQVSVINFYDPRKMQTKNVEEFPSNDTCRYKLLFHEKSFEFTNKHLQRKRELIFLQSVYKYVYIT